ncbi:MAG: hypothetical protein JWR80_6700 [Bradyrhizobium sp.]|nr:hypothetical protein [Bradyrhizobium sp.]
MAQLNYTVRAPIVAVDQGDADLCWLAATAVLYTWKDSRPCTMTQAANRLGVEFIAHQAAASALSYAELALWRTRGPFDLQHQQCIGANGWDALLRAHGPLITLVDGNASGAINHAVVVYGIEGDGGVTSTWLRVANGLGGTLQRYTFRDFVTIFEIAPGNDELFSVLYCR